MSEIKPEIEIYKGVPIIEKDKDYHNMVTITIPVIYHFNTLKQAKQYIDNKLLKRR